MKKQFLYLSTLVLANMLFIGCVKSYDDPEPQPPAPRKSMKYKVLEYHTNIPIYNATLELGYCAPDMGGGCANYSPVGTWLSDINGEILIRAGEVRRSVNMNSFKKDDYWTKGSGDTAIIGATQDSILVRLFPFSWLKIHIKNEISYATPVNIIMHFDAIFDSLKTDQSPRQTFIHAATNFDTTLLYETFGNIKNIVIANIDSAGLQRQLYAKTLFVNKKDTLNFEIHLK